MPLWLNCGMPKESALPSPAGVALSDPVRDLWFQRLRQSIQDRYMGIPMVKLPEDLRVYEHLLWLSRANVVIELGTKAGGSALWFRDRLAALAACGRIDRPLVISIDLRTTAAQGALESVDPSWRESIALLAGDIRDASLVEEVRRMVPPGARCLVSEDSAHTYETTLAALRGFAQFVPVGGFFVVEDGAVDVEEMRPPNRPGWPRGVLPALHEWLEGEGTAFRMRRDLELYGLSSNVEGYLERVP
jgi:cephalosporin hydroxylase